MDSHFEQFNIPDRIKIVSGNGGLPKIVITTPVSSAEIYLQGTHVTAFQKNGEPPLLFMSRLSPYAPGKALRGGVPICFPWFGPRDGQPAHGFVRIVSWDIAETSATKDGVTVRLRLPQASLKPEWSALHTEFVVTVSDSLTMELIATNAGTDKTLEIENCLHTYFHVGDIGAVGITGLQAVPFIDNAAGGNGAVKVENDPVLRLTKETNRIYPDTKSTVEIRDDHFKRTIRVEKFNSNSTVVWNPWTTQLMADFDPAEHKNMVCVESGNVKKNSISLAPGTTTALKVILHSQKY